MVGLVLVSHSAELAASVKALAEQQTQGKAAIAAVGGTGDPDAPFGTDAMAIMEAIQSVYTDDGVLVMMDLGSALLSTEMALEFLEPGQREHIRMSAGPFVEGAMAAAVQASVGAVLDAVAAEAAEALQPKAESLGFAVEEPGLQPEAGERAAEAEGEEKRATIVLSNPAGLHFGPAVQFVQAAAARTASVTVRNLTTGAGPVDAKRFNQVMSLGAEQGHEIEIRAQGTDAAEVVEALLSLARAGFGEQSVAQAPAEPEPTTEIPTGAGRLILQGIGASPGVAVGTTVRLADPGELEVGPAQRSLLSPQAEWERFQSAAEQAKTDLAALAGRMERELGPEQARIFQAHALMLDDPDFLAAVREQIETNRLTAEGAVAETAEALAQSYEQMSGARFQERAADLRDLRMRLLRIFAGISEQAVELPEAAVIVAEDLSPSQTATLDRDRVVAFCTALGGPTAHTAILARSMGIPAVLGMGAEAYRQIPSDSAVAINGSQGTVILDPDAETVADYRSLQEAQAAARKSARKAAQAPARTRDGQRVEVVANLATPAEAEAALEAGAEGIGLLRTEFLFQDRMDPPSEEEQYQVYRQVAEVMAPRPVIIRTLDIGGDKPAPYLRLPEEDNPFLGWRAIRVCLAMPDFFQTQLRAILRAAAGTNISVMFPMVSTATEIVEAKRMLRQAAAELAETGVEHKAELPVGIMVEVPAAAEIPDLLAPMIDFFSIGTNDLTQYTFAADRGNPRVAELADALHPAVLRQIARVIEASHAAGRWTGLCGELAGVPEAIPILLGLGLDEFSMNAASIPEAKAMLARLTVPQAQKLARQALDLPDGAAVRAAIKEVISTL